MKAYRLSVNLKLGLILFAGAIAIASLWYTNAIVNQLRDREASIVQLYAQALAQVPKAAQVGASNPYQAEFRELDRLIVRGALRDVGGGTLTIEKLEDYRRAVLWAQGMPPANDLTFILDAFLEPNIFDIPAILVDSSRTEPIIWRNVDVPAETVADLAGPDSLSTVRRLEREIQTMLSEHEPIPIDVTFEDQGGGASFRLVQYMLYGESALVADLRRFPFIQLLFVALFVLVGYLGFSYVRRSEQSSLWVGMAKEAAHQLGTPISSLMGWLEVLRMKERTPDQEETALQEIETDLQRLRRVTNRFSDIGSLPKLERMPVHRVVDQTLDYMRPRLPRVGREIRLESDVPGDLHAQMNSELFEWVIENLVKNALDAIEDREGAITVTASRREREIRIDVRDTGKGIDRRAWRNVFRPGYSTKKRGWGLGLSLAKRIVEDYHGGTLTLAWSRVGEGTTFRIELPAD